MAIHAREKHTFDLNRIAMDIKFIIIFMYISKCTYFSSYEKSSQKSSFILSASLKLTQFSLNGTRDARESEKGKYAVNNTEESLGFNNTEAKIVGFQYYFKQEVIMFTYMHL